MLGDEGRDAQEVASIAGAFAANLGHPDPLAAAAAERVVVRVCERAQAWGPSPERERVEAIVAAAARAYSTHERQGVMRAVIRLIERGRHASPLVTWLDRAGAERSAFVAALRSGRDEAISRLRAWEFLSRPWAASACEDRLMRRSSEAEREAIVDAWWLAWHPVRAARLGKPKLAAAAWPGAVWADAEARRGALAMARRCGPGAETMASVCEAALVDPDDRVRLAALGVSPTPVLQDFVFDASEAIARSAALRLSTVGERARANDFWNESLARSPHESVRVIAAGERRAEERAVTRSADEHALVAMARSLVSQWDEGEAPERARVARRARAVGLEEALRDRLIEAVQRGEAGDPSVSAAVGALAGVAGRDAADTLSEAVHHADPRVRSNAVEAVVRRECAWGESPAWLSASLLELKNDPHHRVRATSLRAMFIRADEGDHGDATRGIVAAGAIGLVHGHGFEPVAGLWLADRVLGLSRSDAAWRGELIETARRVSGASGRARARARGIVERFGEHHEDDEPGAALALAA